MSTYYVPGTVTGTFCELLPMFSKILSSRYYHLHTIDEERKPQKLTDLPKDTVSVVLTQLYLTTLSKEVTGSPK